MPAEEEEEEEEEDVRRRRTEGGRREGEKRKKKREMSQKTDWLIIVSLNLLTAQAAEVATAPPAGETEELQEEN